MSKIKLVEYSDSYASKLADMWNKSGDGWFGDDSIETEESIRESESKKGNLKTFLAVDEDEVVGYCSFSEYKEDEGASYIPLLNVRPDYHGKKVGKMLVKHVVNQSIGEKWPRLDLYTWPGNTKAVPLYKKCGFFWEKDDISTHLMNFIPYVMKTEALNGYFENMDWYSDCKRNIKVERDGREERKNDFYEYVWEKDGLFLRTEFERKGRGLTLIENNDYKVECFIDNHELIFGSEYEVIYRLENKSGRELKVNIEGVDNKNIKCSFSKCVDVTEKMELKEKFFLDKPLKKVGRLKSYPTLNTLIKINGDLAEFKVGIDAKYPIEVEAKDLNKPYFRGNAEELYLEVKNNFKEDVRATIVLPSNNFVDFDKELTVISLKAEEQKLITIPFKVKDFGFYKENVIIKVEVNKGSVEFERVVTFAIGSYESKFHGEDEQNLWIFNGEYKVKFDKNYNEVSVLGYDSPSVDVPVSYVMYPKVGLPYSLELAKKTPSEVLYHIEGSYSMMKIAFDLNDFKGLRLWNIVKLYANGIMENNYEIENLGHSIAENIKVTSSYYNDLTDAMIPYENKLVQINSTDGANLSYWDANKISENWVFFDNYHIKRSIVFNEELKIKFDGWYSYFEDDFGVIEPGKSVLGKPVYICCNTFNTWEAVRRFALKGNIKNDLEVIRDIDVEVNKGNPFINERFKIDIQEIKNRNVEGSLEVIYSENKLSSDISKGIETSDSELSGEPSSSIKVLDIKIDSKNNLINKDYAVFFKGNDEIKIEEKEEHGMKVTSMKNAGIEVQFAPEYAPGVSSVSFKENEWIEKAFPNYNPRGGFNPWLGGSIVYPRISTESLRKEKSVIEIVELEDNFKNKWKGIKSTLDIKENDKYRGLVINQYTLMISGLPILCELVEVINNSNKYLVNEVFRNEKWVKYGDTPKEGSFIVKHNNGEVVEYKCGSSDTEIDTNKLVIFKSVSRDEKMHVYVASQRPVLCAVNDNKHDFVDILYKITMKHGEKKLLPLSFTIFSENEFTKEMFKKLDNIKFDI